MTIDTGRTIDDLRGHMSGPVITPDDDGYDAARTVFNAMIDMRPSVIAQCDSDADVAAALGFARNRGLEISVRGGGHSVAGMGLTEGGLVLDLRRMSRVDVDPDEGVAVVSGGATMSHLDRACEPYRLATTGGRVSTTGVGGFTLGGGNGWLDRLMGLASDNLVSVDLVTADGSRVRAATDEHPDLFWALHGGGGNFGVATSLTLRLHPLPITTFGFLLWPADRAPEVIRAYRDRIECAPDQFGGGILILTGPDEEFVPAEHVGTLMLAIVIVHAGSESDLRDVAAPILALDPVGQLIAEMPYADIQSSLDDPPGMRNYWSAEHLDSLPDAAIDAFCRSADGLLVPSPAQHALFPLGGAVSRGNDDDPISWRDAPWVVHPFGLWPDAADDERMIRWARDARAAVQPWASGSVYLNFIGDEGSERVVAGHGQEKYQRLAEVKARYDPDNVFHRNHNIVPMPAPTP
jgi:FAD/FMN-containing dehydrogenase